VDTCRPLFRQFLAHHPQVRLHFTRTYSSSLNQVDIGFGKTGCEVIARGTFASAPDLARKLRRYMHACSTHARPGQWQHSGPARRRAR
jgi:hypothetical protein